MNEVRIDRTNIAVELRNLARAEKASKMLGALPRSLYPVIGRVLADISAEAAIASATDVDRYIELRGEKERLLFELRNLLQFRIPKIHRISMYSLEEEKGNLVEREMKLLDSYKGLLSEFSREITGPSEGSQ